MRKLKYMLMAVLAPALFVACEEDLDTVTYDQEAAVTSVLTIPATSLELLAENAEDTLAFEWTQADLGYSAAVNYVLEVDVTGKSFSQPSVLVSLPIDKTVETMVFEISVKDLNNTLIKQLGKYEDLEVDGPVVFEFRVLASVSSVLELVSATATSEISVYSGALPGIYMIGEGVGGWSLDLAVEVFHAGAPDTYHTKAYFSQANFRFFNQPDWGASIGGYDVFTVYPEEYLAESSDDDPNFAFVGAAGWYEIVVNVAAGSIELAPIDDPTVYLTGSATHGWDFDEPVTSIKWVNYNRWEGEVDFIKDGHFRFFGQKDWSPASYGHDTVVNYDTDFIIIAEGHGDPNWQFVAESGTYYVVLDLEFMTVEITPL